MKRGERGTVARTMDVTPRTLWNWAHRPKAARPPGRPPPSPEQHARAKALVAEVLQDQGRGCGRDTLRRVLGDRVPPGLQRRCLKEIRTEQARADRAAAQERRRGVQVLCRDAVWSLDALHLDRTAAGALEALVVRDVASTATIAVRVGVPATAADVVGLLEQARRARGALPAVLAVDNGAPFVALLAQLALAGERVVVLRNLPRTPQHNPWVEHGNGELRQEAGLPSRQGKARLRRTSSRRPSSLPDPGVREANRAFHEPPQGGVDDASPLHGQLVLAYALAIARALDTLDAHRLRRTRGYRTAVAVDAELAPWYRAVAREDFHDAACEARRKAVLGCNTKRGRRLAEREATLATMQQYGLVSRTRGGAPLPLVKAEEVSCHPQRAKTKQRTSSAHTRSLL